MNLMVASADLLNRTAEAWWRWMATMSLQVAVLACIVFVIDRILARRVWPQLRAALWIVVLVKLVVPPTVSSPVSIARLNPELAAPVSHDGVAVAAWSASPGAAGVALALWLCGFIAFCGLTLWRYGRVRRQYLGGGAVAHGERMRAAMTCAARRLGLRAVPRVAVRRGVPGPAVVGFPRPVVVIPASLAETASVERLEHVLLHEFAHVRRRDPLAAWACLLVQAVYWFHPAVWLMQRRLAALRELCCDQAVARVLGDATPDYRRTLLEMSRRLIYRASPSAMGFVHTHSQLLARLEWLDRPPGRGSLARRAATSIVFALLVACCVPLSLPLIAPMPAILAFQSPALDEVDGCMQKRFVVMQAMARLEYERRNGPERESNSLGSRLD
jgi:beta-lactamase regulating signal transducer with metallopeptidase domain